MILELFSYVNFINAMAFVYAYIKCLQLFFSDFLHYFDTSIVIIDCYPAGVSNKHCLLPLSHFAGNKDNHKSFDEFEFPPDSTTDCRVRCS